MATILLPTLLRKYADGAAEVVVEGATVGAVLEALFTEFPDLRARMIDRRERIRRHVLPFHGDRPLPREDYAGLPLEQDATLRFLVAVAGG